MAVKVNAERIAYRVVLTFTYFRSSTLCIGGNFNFAVYLIWTTVVGILCERSHKKGASYRQQRDDPIGARMARYHCRPDSTPVTWRSQLAKPRFTVGGSSSCSCFSLAYGLECDDECFTQPCSSCVYLTELPALTKLAVTKHV